MLGVYWHNLRPCFPIKGATQPYFSCYFSCFGCAPFTSFAHKRPLVNHRVAYLITPITFTIMSGHASRDWRNELDTFLLPQFPTHGRADELLSCLARVRVADHLSPRYVTILHCTTMFGQKVIDEYPAIEVVMKRWGVLTKEFRQIK